jgi:hypothetical protein
MSVDTVSTFPYYSARLGKHQHPTPALASLLWDSSAESVESR